MKDNVKLIKVLSDSGRILATFLIALILGGIFLAVLGQNPIEAYVVIFSKAFNGFDQVLRRMTPLMLTGLAVAIPLKTGMLNMGGEGQIAAGSLVGALVGAYLPLPGGIHPIVCLIAAGIAGGFIALIPAFLKVKFGAGEVVTSIMLNYVIIYLIRYLTMYPLRASANMPQTADVLGTAMLARPVIGDQWSWGLFIALGICVIMQFFLEKTKKGLELKSAGLSPLTAKYQGINIKALSMVGMVIGGTLAGMGGTLEILGGKYAYLDGYFDNYGFDGVAICYMAKGNPIVIILTSFVISVIRVGAAALDRRTNISVFFSVALYGVIIILLVSPNLIDIIMNFIKKIFVKKSKIKEEV